MNRIAKLVPAAAAIAVLLGCSRTPGYVGTWKHEAGILSATVVLNPDGTVIGSSAFGNGNRLTWRQDGDHISLLPAGNAQPVATGKLNSDGTSLVLSDARNTVILVRQSQ